MKLLKIICFVVTIVELSSCKQIDNFKAPDTTFYGKIVNSKGETVQQRVVGATGLKLNLYDTNPEYVIAQQFYATQDGSFCNAMLFSGRYKVNLDQTNFHSVQDIVIDIHDQTMHDFEVVPFCEVAYLKIEHIGGKRVKAKFKLRREKNENCKIISYALYAHVSPHVDDIVGNYRVRTEIQTTEQDELLLRSDREFEMQIDMDDDSQFKQKYEHIVRDNNNLIYVRVGVTTLHAEDKYMNSVSTNFSCVEAVQIDLN